MSTTWILVADRARARLFAMSDEDRSLHEIEDFLNPDGRAAGREIEQDRPPRTHDRFGASRHAIEPRTTLREKTARNFAQTLDAALERGRAGHRYDQLVLIAPPQFLGTLNSVLDKQVRACVAAEVPNDLTLADADAVLEHLPAHLRPSGAARRH
ncbi:host attachment protein [Vulcaniibacterium gelatinicum]|uniref:host attachment protein n=1 Tax=Vulcaniibacterium gelatinicum TaxID=2598725 RepID=UPI0015F2BF87|nr:host attachment protein [Vulcaniibacterium gelatinicum]